MTEANKIIWIAYFIYYLYYSFILKANNPLYWVLILFSYIEYSLLSGPRMYRCTYAYEDIWCTEFLKNTVMNQYLYEVNLNSYIHPEIMKVMRMLIILSLILHKRILPMPALNFTCNFDQ